MSSEDESSGISKRAAKRKRQRQQEESKKKRSTDAQGRAVWDIAEYQNEDAPSVQIGAPKRERLTFALRDQPQLPLSAREKSEISGIKSQVGVVKSLSDEKSGEAGFFCEKCNKLLKDSKSWLDHINSKKHLTMTGVGNRAIRASVDDVMETLKALEEKKGGGKKVEFSEKRETANVREEQVEEEEEEDEETAAMRAMGIVTSFASSKKK
jgi:U4/U6.U5 tri-snRNP component SNU23